MFTPSNRRQMIAQRLGDAGTDRQYIGTDAIGNPISVDNLPNGVSEDIPSSVYITPGQFTNYDSGMPDVATITAGQFTDYVPPSVNITPSQMTQTNDTAAAIAATVSGAVSAYQAIQLQNLQIARVNAGLPPLTAAQMASIAGQMPVQSSMDTTTMLLLGGGALLLMMMVMKKNHSGSRRH